MNTFEAIRGRYRVVIQYYNAYTKQNRVPFHLSRKTATLNNPLKLKLLTFFLFI